MTGRMIGRSRRKPHRWLLTCQWEATDKQAQACYDGDGPVAVMALDATTMQGAFIVCEDCEQVWPAVHESPCVPVVVLN